MKILIIFILILCLGAFASEDYLAGVLLAILGAGLTAVYLRRTKKVTSAKAVNSNYEAFIESREELNGYYAYMEAIQKYEKSDVRKSLGYVTKTIPILGQFVDNTIKSYGSFDIGTIPAIDVGCRYWGALEDTDNLTIMKKAIEEKKELKRWLPSIEAAYEDAKLAGKIKEFLINNPGAPQNTLGKSLNVSGRDTSRIIKSLENIGIVKREPQGKTYKLYLEQT